MKIRLAESRGKRRYGRSRIDASKERRRSQGPTRGTGGHHIKEAGAFRRSRSTVTGPSVQWLRRPEARDLLSVRVKFRQSSLAKERRGPVVLICAALLIVMSTAPDGGSGTSQSQRRWAGAPVVDMASPWPPRATQLPSHQRPFGHPERPRRQKARAEARMPPSCWRSQASVQDSGGGPAQTLSLRGAARCQPLPTGSLWLARAWPWTSPYSHLRVGTHRGAARWWLNSLRTGAMGGVVNLVTRAPDGTSRVFADAHKATS